jgi:polar amino acid transport system substrate-binding protein
MQVSSEIISAFAPTGTLRTSINLGNPILANKDPITGLPVGVSIDLATNLAKLLGVDIELAVFDAAGKSVEAVAQEQVDIGFFAIDPLRGESISFTAAYVLIEGCYLVRETSSIRSNEEVDGASNRVTVGKASAYDLYLTRHLMHARIERAPTSQTVVDVFMEKDFEVAAGVKQQLEGDMNRFQNLRLLPGRFMVIHQAMGVPKSRGQAAARFLQAYVEAMKASGFVAKSLEQHRIMGASVAPPNQQGNSL